MKASYTTNRLILKLLTPCAAREVLEFRTRNRELFEQYEPSLPENFYTISYQQKLLKCEQKLALSLSTVRFYVFPKEAPSHIIGTVCLHDILRMPYCCCEIGYKFDSACQHQGYAREAVAKALEIAFGELSLHRVFARVMPENTASIHLLEALHFTAEGIEHGCTQIQGVWQDHLRYGILTPYEASTLPDNESSSQTD